MPLSGSCLHVLVVLLLGEEIGTWQGRLVLGEQTWIQLANVVLWSRPVGCMGRLMKMRWVCIVIAWTTVVGWGAVVHLVIVVVVLVHHVVVLGMVHIIVTMIVLLHMTTTAHRHVRWMQRPDRHRHHPGMVGIHKHVRVLLEWHIPS